MKIKYWCWHSGIKEKEIKPRPNVDIDVLNAKMIEQKKRDLPAINFESNEDSLDGFDLAEFNPR